MGQKTTEWFVAKAKSIYGDKFDYSKSKYIFSSIPIEIVCKIHGSFWQRSGEHFLGRGCPICNRRLTLEKFVEKANCFHQNKYDYSLIKEESILGNMLLMIKCPEHGAFQQKAKDHITRNGCKICGKLKSAESRRKTTEQFIAKSNEIHGNKYDYSKVVYISSTRKVEITCLSHGSFWQTPANHAHKTGQQGCPNCAGNIRLTTGQFVEKAKTVHGDEYDYCLVQYVDSKTKLTVICKKHGKFNVLSSNHLKGQKCPKCTHRVSSGEIAWLDSLNVPKECRQKVLVMNSGRKYEVDAYNPETNTVFEFYGDYWHGNPARFHKDGWNERTKNTFGQLYQKTLDKENDLKANGFVVVTIWEKDFLQR